MSKRDLDRLVVELEKQNQNLRERLTSIENSLSWRLTSPLRLALSPFSRMALRSKKIGPIGQLSRKIQQVGGLRRAFFLAYALVRSSGIKSVVILAWLVLKTGESSGKVAYDEWAKKFLGSPSPSRFRFIKRQLGRENGPRISIVLPTYNSVTTHLSEAVESVRSQKYENWELLLVDDASTKQSTIRYLKQVSKLDPRIKVSFRSENGHISKASNEAIANASGEYITFLDHDDVLTTDALEAFVERLASNPDVKFVYSDEDKIDKRGVLSEPHFKPDLNRTLALSYNYFCHMSFYKTDLVRRLGGLRSEFDGAQDYDLALRVLAELPDEQIEHIPKVLYHWRKTGSSTAQNIDAKSYASNAGLRAVVSHLASTKTSGKVVVNPEINFYNRVKFATNGTPLVSIIIPTRDHVQILKVCIRSILARTSYSNFEIIVVDNDSVEKKTLEYFSQLKKLGVKIVSAPGEFNYSKINNMAVASAAGEYICLLNNDIEVKSKDWLTELLSHAQRPGIGAVGARLWYPNGQLQHGGVVLGLGGISGVAGHSHKYFDRSNPGYMGRAKVAQEFSAVTAACLLVRKSSYLEVGGLTEELKVAFNDVDFCLKLLRAGYKNVWTPFAELVHHESISRGIDTSKKQVLRAANEVMYMRKNWSELLDNDPSYNRHLTKNHEDFSLSWPPRKMKPNFRP